jgi:hypothetical protein
MRELFEVLFSIAVPTAALVGYALILARREDRESRGETQPQGRKISRILAAAGPDPDAHLGRVGTE